jgi:hypothetical protein
MDDDSRETIEYLRAQPRGGTIRWASDHLTAERPWATSWIDVRIPDGGPGDMNWVWTILDPKDADEPLPGQLWQFAWPHDLEIHSVFDPERGWYVNELPVPAGESLPESVVAGYKGLAIRVETAYRNTGCATGKPVPAAIYEDLIARTGSAYSVRGGWSVRTVCDALSDWTARHAGRDDLRFGWDAEAGDSPCLELAKARAAAGDLSWDLGDGLKVVDGLMDELLELMATDPEEAARVTRVLRESVEPLLDTPPDQPSGR